MCQSKEKTEFPNSPSDERKRRFLIASTKLLALIGTLAVFKPFISSWFPARQLKSTSPLRVDLKDLQPGQKIIVQWQGKPIWIFRRTKLMLENLTANRALLRDPDSFVTQQPSYATNEYRSINPEYLVLVGLCTHLGCSPNLIKENQHHALAIKEGFYCPCHGSTFDLAGRVLKNMPAPINLAVPPHHFITKNILIIGEG